MTAVAEHAPWPTSAPGSGEHDGGILGADAVAWAVISHPAALIGGLRALLIQSLHPLAMAGVAQHSDYRDRALSRLRGTAHYVGATVLGDTPAAHAAAARVRRIHGRVRGIDPVTGQAYSADDPDTQLWVHAVEWHSFLAAHRAFGPKLTPQEEDRYIAEGVPITALVGTPADRVPDSVATMRAYFQSVRPRLCVSAAARDAIDFVTHPPVTRELAPYQLPLRVYASAAQALVPHELRAMAGIDRSRARDTAAIALARPWVAALKLPGARELGATVVGRDVRQLHIVAEERFGPLTVRGMRARRDALA